MLMQELLCSGGQSVAIKSLTGVHNKVHGKGALVVAVRCKGVVVVTIKSGVAVALMTTLCHSAVLLL